MKPLSAGARRGAVGLASEGNEAAADGPGGRGRPLRFLTGKGGLVLAASVLALAVLGGGAYALTSSGGSSTPAEGGSSNALTQTDANSVNSSLTAPGGTPAQTVALANLDTATQKIIAATSRVEANPRDPASWDAFSRAAQQASNAMSSTAWPPTVQAQAQRLAETVSSLSADAVRVAADLRSNDKAGTQTDGGQFEKDLAAYLAASSEFSRATRNAALG